MAKHLVARELRRRGIHSEYFCKQHEINIYSFYATIAGKCLNKKAEIAFKKEGLLYILFKEHPNLKRSRK